MNLENCQANINTARIKNMNHQHIGNENLDNVKKKSFCNELQIGSQAVFSLFYAVLGL